MECRSARELVRSSGDAWYAAPGLVVWRVGELDGASLWGRVTNAQIDAVFAVSRAQTEETDRAFDLVTDLGAVTSIDDGVYLRVASYLAELASRIEPRLRRHVVIIPDGMMRAAVAGFLHLHAHHPWQLEVELVAGIGEDAAAKVAAIVEPRRHHDLVAALRAQPRCDSLPEAAKLLGVAPRTLQRALQIAGTCFREVAEEIRIGEACRLLDETDLKVEAIAHEVGYGSLSGFVRSFRRVSGCSPNERRVRRTA